MVAVMKRNQNKYSEKEVETTSANQLENVCEL